MGDCETDLGGSSGEAAREPGEATRGGCELNLVGVKGREDGVGLKGWGVGEEDRTGLNASPSDCCFFTLNCVGVEGRAEVSTGD